MFFGKKKEPQTLTCNPRYKKQKKMTKRQKLKKLGEITEWNVYLEDLETGKWICSEIQEEESDDYIPPETMIYKIKKKKKDVKKKKKKKPSHDSSSDEFESWLDESTDEEEEEEKTEKKKEESVKSSKKEKSEPGVCPSGKDCPICLDSLETSGMIVVSICRDELDEHFFHQDCLFACYNEENNFLKCPLCRQEYGYCLGPMPKGTMHISYPNVKLAGYQCGTISMSYNFPNGIQGKEHPNPGQTYQGTSRVGYLPDNKIGRVVLKKLKIAFKRRKTFCIGTSVTTGRSNCVIWNGIHHKTNTAGGYSQFGYPDEGYFERVLSELYNLGIK